MTNLTTALAAIRARLLAHAKELTADTPHGTLFTRQETNFERRSCADIRTLLAAVERLSGALQFYGDDESKANLYGKFSSQFNSDYENYQILADKGKRARNALAEVEQMFANGGSEE